MKVFLTGFEITQSKKVVPDDIVNAVLTLAPKFVVKNLLKHPGKGPNFFLDWSKKELEKGITSIVEDDKNRAFFNSATFSKAAFECLIDWYIQRYYLSSNLPKSANIARKLKILNSEKLLSVNFELFNEIIFSPRNTSVHKYELVKQDEAQNSYNLAALTIENCVHKINPSSIPIYFGDILWAKDNEIRKYVTNYKVKGIKVDHYYFFGGVGKRNSAGFYFSVLNSKVKLSVIRMLSDVEADIIWCDLNEFEAESVFKILTHLEISQPTELNLEDDFKKFVKDSFDSKISLKSKIK